MSLETIFQHTVEHHRMFRAGQRVLVAVSGGPDSTALLHLLVSLARSLPLELHVAHLDHGLRGPDSRQDRRFVESMARDLGLPCTVQVLDASQGSRTGLSEGRARELRYRFLGQLAQQVVSVLPIAVSGRWDEAKGGGFRHESWDSPDF